MEGAFFAPPPPSCDAFIKPVVTRQLGSMRREPRRARRKGRKWWSCASNGGEMSLDAAVEAPIQIAVSGPPPAGVIAAKRTAELLGLPNLRHGSTWVEPPRMFSTVVDGREKFTTDFRESSGGVRSRSR